MSPSILKCYHYVPGCGMQNVEQLCCHLISVCHYSRVTWHEIQLREGLLWGSFSQN